MPIKIGTTDFKMPIAKAIIGQTVVYEPKSTKTVSYYGQITDLTGNANLKTWGDVGGYALFVGGQNGDYRTSTNKVEIYDKDLTHSNGTDLGENRRSIVFAKVGNYGCFMGGITGSTTTTPSKAYCYDNTDLTRTVINMQNPRYGGAGASSANLAIAYGEGHIQGLGAEALDKDLTLIVGANPGGTYFHCNFGARAGNYAVFGGAYNFKTTAKAFNDDLTITACDNLSVGRFYSTCATIKNKAVAMGGTTNDSNTTNYVDIYDENLTHTTTTLVANVIMKDACKNMPSVNKYTMAGNMYTTASNNYTVFIDEDLVSQSLSENGVTGLSCGATGNYFIVCGGNTNTASAKTAYAYVVQ